MKTENAFSPIAVGGDDQDDINALSDAFSLKAFRYIDIAREARLQQVLSRWPLLNECAMVPESER
ncbi:cellulose biosynthesis protein BcsR [Pantoea dispersa]|uniref:cellulose biosynthesis protein BcsR n=1 Tax=Pantoea dispersa TaxID=59814 RepID=UPI002DBD7252|nr:cellulose biosynthesis protein BcsR [Pantoea dispersa]MEB5973824.1 cellulose biosynthesis protein BcsR [Pantoea dispersa]